LQTSGTSRISRISLLIALMGAKALGRGEQWSNPE
jgi:hypothetical protein